jgi:hypothetical protein
LALEFGKNAENLWKAILILVNSRQKKNIEFTKIYIMIDQVIRKDYFCHKDSGNVIEELLSKRGIPSCHFIAKRYPNEHSYAPHNGFAKKKIT